MSGFGGTSTSDAMQAAAVVVTTDANGGVQFTFARPFAAPPVVVITGDCDGAGVVPVATPTTTGFRVQFKDGAGVLIINTPVRCYWIATPATQ